MGDTTPQPSANKTRRGSSGPRLIGVVASRLTRPVLGKHGFAVGAIVTDWEAIVGRELAAHVVPSRVSFVRGERTEGTLHVRVAGGAFAMDVQHRAPILIERINAYFGYRAVARVKIAQGPISRRTPVPPRTPNPLDAREQAALDAEVAPVEDGSLREALSRLGRAVLGRS